MNETLKKLPYILQFVILVLMALGLYLLNTIGQDVHNLQDVLLQHVTNYDIHSKQVAKN